MFIVPVLKAEAYGSGLTSMTGFGSDEELQALVMESINRQRQHVVPAVPSTRSMIALEGYFRCQRLVQDHVMTDTELR